MTGAVVLDASALVEALRPGKEERAVALAEFQSARRSLGPSILAYELAQVVHVKRRGEFRGTVSDRSGLVAALLDGVELVEPDAATLARAGEVAEAEGLSAYDAAYLVVTERTPDTVLVSEDRRLVEAARRRLGTDRALGLDELVQRLARGEG